MIIQVQYRPAAEPLHGYDFGNDIRMYTFDDVNEFVSQASPIHKVTQETFGNKVWGNEVEDKEGVIFPYRPADEYVKPHVFVDFSLGDSSTDGLYAFIRAAKWRDSKDNFHFLIMCESAHGFLMTNEGKTIRKF